MAVRAKDVGSEYITPREYQVELCHRAASSDSIILLPPGTGKTYIAILVTRKMAGKLGPDKKTAVYVVSNDILIDEHYTKFNLNTPLTVGKWTEEINESQIIKFRNFFKENDIVILTSYTFHEALVHSIVSLKQVALLVLDECHHCLGDFDSYRLIAELYKKAKADNEDIRLLGLTGCGINQRVTPSRIRETFVQLEAAIGAPIVTANVMLTNARHNLRPVQVLQFANIERTIVDMTQLLKLDYFISNNGDFSEGSDVDPRKDIKNRINKTLYVSNDCGIYGGYQYAKLAEKHFSKCIDEQYVGPAMLSVISACKTAFKNFCLTWDAKLENLASWEAIKPYLSGSVIKIIELLESYYKLKSSANSNMTCLVFVDKRNTAIALASVLRLIASKNPRFAFIKADYAIGSAQNNEKLEQSVAQSSDQRFNEAIHSIRNGTKNVLVTTSILEEGVDIRNCNCVIRLGCPITYASFALMRGRCRTHPSLFAVVLDPKNNTEINELQNYYDIDKILFDKMSCSQNAVNVAIPSTIHEDELENDYVTEAGAILKLSNAVGVLNRYAARLPSDVFTRLVLDIHSKREGFGYRSILFFPMNCPVKDLATSKVMSTIRLSQMSVAFEACKILHTRGEIDDNLYPVVREKISTKQDLADEFGDLAPNLPHVTGSSKKRRLYSRIVAVTLNNSLPQPGQNFYVYVIDMDMVEPISESSNPKRRRIINPKDMNRSFGLCSTKKIPSIPSFPIYQRQGKMQIRFICLPQQFNLNEKQLQMVQRFHEYIVEEILNMRHNMEFQPGTAPFSTLLVPLKHSNEVYSIDYDVLTNTVKGFPAPPTQKEREAFVYNPDYYQDAVVRPWYRSNESIAFYIGEVNTNLFPHSNFADEKYNTFDHYFEHKYNLPIYNKEQQLLDVDNASVRMNLLLPRVVQSRSIRRGADPSQKQFMIPELVVVHPMPATFWVMVVGLPTILFRMNCLLLADEFRARVAKDALNLIPETPEGHVWEPLQYLVSANNMPITVRNINQLKLVNDNADDEMVANESKKAPEFVIDVWDPNLGEKFIDSPLNSLDEHKSVSPAFFDDDMSDDDEKWRNNVKIDKFDTTWKPATVDVPSVGNGWDDTSVPEPQVFSDTQVSLSSTAGIDATSLLLDLEKITPGQAVYKRQAHVKYSDPVEAMDEKDELEKQARAKTKEPEDNLDYWLHENFNEVVIGEDIDFNFEDLRDESTATDLAFPFPMSKTVDTDVTEFTFNCTAETVITSDPVMQADVQIPYFCDLPLSERVTAPMLSPYMNNWFIKDKSADNPYGVAPTILLQALTTSSASDGFNLERLETIGDSFLKLSVTNYLYHSNPCDNEGALSSQRSKEVSNSNLFKLGRMKGIATLMECGKFEPTVNWLPPGFIAIGTNFDSRIIDSDETEKVEGTGWDAIAETNPNNDGIETIVLTEQKTDDIFPYPFNNLTQQNISDKAIADCVEALIGAHLVELGPQKALEFMRYMDLKVLCDHPPISSPIDYDMPLFMVTEDESDGDAKDVEVPKALGDVFESLAGAVYLDCGMDLTVVWRVFYKIMQKSIEKCCKDPPQSPIRELFEMRNHTVRFAQVDVNAKENTVSVTVKIDNGNFCFTGTGRSHRIAKTTAAKKALRYLHSLDGARRKET